MANPFPFTIGQTLTADNLNGIGETTTYTPTWSNFTLGNGTQSWKYTRVNNNILVYGYVIFGSTSSITGVVTQSFPILADTITNSSVIGWGSGQDTGTATYPLTVYQFSTNTFGIYTNFTDGTNLGGLRQTSSTVPFTWTTTDEIRVNFVYRAA